MKEIWFGYYEEKLNEMLDDGIDEEIAEDIAIKYADYKYKHTVSFMMDWDEKSNN